MKYLLIDGNSIGFAAQSMPKLHDAEGNETQAMFGFLRTLRNLMSDDPEAKPIVFWDGRSWRYEHFAEYKDGRQSTEAQVKERESYTKQRPSISRILKFLGVEQHIAFNMEADDLIALMTEKPDTACHYTIVSGDRDLLQLVKPGVDWLNPIRLPGGKTPKLLRVTDESFEEDTEYANADKFVLGKALLGDKSDNLDGIEGIGKKAAPLVVSLFPSLRSMIDDIKLRGDAAIPKELSRYKKKLKDFVASEEAQRRLARNFRLMRLTSKWIPEPLDMRVTRMPFDGEAFKNECKKFGFVSILRDFDGWTAPFNSADEVKAAA